MSLRLSREVDGTLLLVVDGVNRGRVRVLRAAPLSDPDRCISLLDGNGEEVAMVANLADLDHDTRALLQKELERVYAGSTIRRVNSARVESDVAYLNVETGDGARDVTVQDVHERIRHFGQRLLITDIDDNRFEIPDIRDLDGRSARFVERVLLRS